MTAHDSSTNLGPTKKLRLLDAVAQSIGFMGPVFSIAFLVPLIMGITSASGRGAGAAAPLAVLIAAIGILAVGWLIAQYAERIHAAGALYDYVSAGLGGRVGGAAGFLYYFGMLALVGATVMILGGTIHDTLDAEFKHALLPEIGWDLVLIALVGFILVRGVAVSTRAQLVLALISIAVVLVFMLYVIAKVGSHQSFTKAFTPAGSTTGLSGVIFGVLYGVSLFGGFESAANLAEETDQPHRNIPRAILFSVLGVTGFYVIASYAQVAGFGFDMKAFSDAAAAPLFALASPHAAGGYGSVTMVRIMELVVILDMLAVLIGVATAASRGLFALGRDERLPKMFARVGKHGTPVGATGFIVIYLLVLILVNKFWTSLWAIPQTPHYVGMFTMLATLGSFGFVVVYFLVSLGSLRGLNDHKNLAGVIIASVIGMAITAAAAFGAFYKVPHNTVWVQLFGLAVFVVGFLIPGKMWSEHARHEHAGV